MHYYQKNVKDWIVATAHLTPEEEGVYNRLMDYYYDTESPIPEKTDWVIRRLRLQGYEETLDLILQEFFVLEDGAWRHRRCDEEIEEYCEKAERARKNGKRGGRPKKIQENQGLTEKPKENPEKTDSVSEKNPDQTETKANHKPLTNTHKPIPNNTYVHFDQFWSLYPKKTNKAKAAKIWNRLKVTDELFEKIAENIRGRLATGQWQDKQFIPDPTTYLNGKRWEDEIIPPGSQSPGRGPPGTNEARSRSLTDDLHDRSWAETNNKPN